MSGYLGRSIPPDFSHVEKHPLAAAPTVATVEKILALPSWHWSHDQGEEGSCVGHGSAMERAVTNNAQLMRITKWLWRGERRYDPIDLWNQAKIVDGDPSTNPGDDNGTYVRAAYDVLRDRGPIRCQSVELRNIGGRATPVPIGDQKSPKHGEGASVNQWATTVDQLRSCIAKDLAISFGVNWYSGFDNPQSAGQHVASKDAPTAIIGKANIGSIRGGHDVCLYGASDQAQAFALKNSWGSSYPLTWIPYNIVQRLLNEQGEATVVVDR